MKTMTDENLLVDEVLAEVRRHKHDIAAEHGFDVIALGRSLQAREATDLRFKKQCEQNDAPNAHPRRASC
jgi:hypothetical protein